MTSEYHGGDMPLDGFQSDRDLLHQRAGNCPELWNEERPIPGVADQNEVLLYYTPAGRPHFYTGTPRRSSGKEEKDTTVGASARGIRKSLSAAHIRKWRLLVDPCGVETCLLCCKVCRRGGKGERGRQVASCKRCTKECNRLLALEAKNNRRVTNAQGKTSPDAALEYVRNDNRVRAKQHTALFAERKKKWEQETKSAAGPAEWNDAFRSLFVVPWPDDKLATLPFLPQGAGSSPSSASAVAPGAGAGSVISVATGAASGTAFGCVHDNSPPSVVFKFVFPAKRKADDDLESTIAKRPRVVQSDALFSFV